MKIDLKGIPAVTVLAVIVVTGLGYRIFLENDFKDNPEIRRELELSLMYEIAGDISADVEAFKAAMARGDTDEAEEMAEGTLKRKITINDLAMKGHGEKIIIRADYTVHGPDGPEDKTGYFKFSHSAITGWRFRGETSAVSWYLTLF